MKAPSKIDLSLTDKSSIKIPKCEYEGLEREIKKVKYPTYAISQAQKLQDKIMTFKNQKVRKKLQKSLQNLNSYRQVRGDGNCFFRALAFSYVSSIQPPSFIKCFDMINEVSLACCQPQSIPKNFIKFYDHKFLLWILQKNWESVYTTCLKQSSNIQKKALLKLFDQNPYLDFIIILYFRSVCLKALYKYAEQLKDFITGGQQQLIRTYSQETEGIAINLSSKIFNISIFVYEVRKQEIISYQYHYDASKIRRKIPNIYLLFYENHYDIIQHNENIQAEQSGLRKKQTYYEEINERLRSGVCQQCKSVGYVNEVSGLCIRCHEVSLTSLNDFANEDTRKAKCQQCRRVKDDVSVSFGLCRECVQIQNRVGQRLKKCGHCGVFSELDEQTGICNDCTNNQKMILSTIQSNKKQKSDEKKSTIKEEYIQQKCDNCKVSGQIKASKINGQVCEECVQKKSNLPVTRSAAKKFQKNCAKCNQKIVTDDQNILCDICLIKTQRSVFKDSQNSGSDIGGHFGKR